MSGTVKQEGGGKGKSIMAPQQSFMKASGTEGGEKGGEGEGSVSTGGKGLVKPPAGADLVVTNTPSHVNYDLCCACGAGGDLLCCDSCPNSFHLDCVEPALETVPKGAWHCNACYALHHPPAHKGAGADNPFFGQAVSKLLYENPQTFHLPHAIATRKRKRGYAYGTRLTRILGAAGRVPSASDAKSGAFIGSSVLDLNTRELAPLDKVLQSERLSVVERNQLTARATSYAQGSVGPNEALNVKWCCACGKNGGGSEGKLLPCDLCARSFHYSCLGLDEDSVVDASWVCEWHRSMDVYAARVRESLVTKRQKSLRGVGVGVGAGDQDSGEGAGPSQMGGQGPGTSFVDRDPVVLDFGLGPQAGLTPAGPGSGRGGRRTASVSVPGVTPFATGATPSVAEQRQWLAGLDALRDAVESAAHASTVAETPLVPSSPAQLQAQLVSLIQEQTQQYKRAVGSSLDPPGMTPAAPPGSALLPSAITSVLGQEFTAFLAWQRLNQLTAQVQAVEAEMLASGSVPPELEVAHLDAAGVVNTTQKPISMPRAGEQYVVASGSTVDMDWTADGGAGLARNAPVYGKLTMGDLVIPINKAAYMVGRGEASTSGVLLGMLEKSSTISREHALLAYDSETKTVSVVNKSSRGTKVNKKKIGETPVVLEDGDVLRIGAYNFVFHPNKA